MDDCDGPNTLIASRQKVVAEKVDSGMLTDPREYRHRGTNSMPCISIGIQTEQMLTSTSSILKGNINNEVLNLILETIKSNNEETNILARLNIFHRTDSVTLSVMKQYQLSQKEELPISDVICGPNGRVAFLFANRYHDTWCSHNGSIVFWQRRVTDHLVLTSCPTVLRYGPQGLIAVGLITGHILIVLNGEIISTNEVHALSVTSLEWLYPLQQLVSVSLDGRIIIHNLKSTVLEEKHSKLITVLNLPRNIRKSNTSAKYIGLTSLCVAKDRLFIGSETGAIWIATIPDLTISLFHYEIDCIETVAHISNYTVITKSSGKVSLFQNSKMCLPLMLLQC
uniref:WD_REPEATS_REGION domain-containing protein n=1 Tax=Elaeophora elaphi TaxID=1147741 RepID=A0A0R3S151_9BILA